jgi:hypothetical protein
MTLIIELTPQEESRLARAAGLKGVAPRQFVKDLISEHLSPSEVSGNSAEDQTAKLFEIWDAEDSHLTPEQIAAAQSDWEQTQEAMNASRAAAGEEPVF